MTRQQEILLHIPGATLHLMEDGEAELVAQGDLTVVRLVEGTTVLATLIKVGNNLQWPLTKDEPVVKLDQLHYLFSLPSEDGEILSYGLSFSQPNTNLASFDSFLMQNSCFSVPLSSTSCPSSLGSSGLCWKDFAPNIDDYNGVLARAIAGGTGQIIKGIFKVSNAYTKQVQCGGEMIRSRFAYNKVGQSSGKIKGRTSHEGKKKNQGVKNSIKRVKMLSEITENMSKNLLNGVVFATGSMVRTLVRSPSVKAFLAIGPSQVLLASLDALDRVLDAAEAAEKEAFSATSKAVTGAVTTRYGEKAGEMTDDLLSTAGHAAQTAWNIAKMRQAMNPKSAIHSRVVQNAVEAQRDELIK